MSVAVCCLSAIASLPLTGQNISAGGYHTLFLCSDGTMMATGGNAFGKLGDGTETSRITPVPVLVLNNVEAIAAGYEHSLALKDDGTVWSWGNNTAGQLGHGNTSQPYLTPTQIAAIAGVSAISGGNLHTLMLRTDGSVWACGNNFYGELGNGSNTDSSLPVQVASLNDVIAIEAAENASYALRSDGTIWAWGNNIYGQLGDNTTNNSNVPVQVFSADSYVAISAHHEHVLALRNDSTVWAWGRNTAGELGNGSLAGSYYPQQVNLLNDVHAIEAGGYYSLALKSDGTVWSFGLNSYGQLGDGSTTDRIEPVQMTALTSCVASISTGFWVGAAYEDPATIKLWGYNFDGELGNGTTVDSNTPISPVGLCPIALPASDPCGLNAVNDIGPASEAWVHPNPFSTSATIRTKDRMRDAVLLVSDATGKVVLQRMQLSGVQFTIDREELADGLYFMELTDGKHRVVGRLIIVN